MFRYLLSLFFVSTLFSWASVADVLATEYCGDGIVSGNEECDDGNFDNRDGCSAYCELEDMDPPVVTSFSIPDGSTGIAPTTKKFTIHFSEPVLASDIRKNDTIQFLSNGENLNYDIQLSADRKSLVISLNQDLFSAEKHALWVQYIKDDQGNILLEKYISIFETSTAVDYLAPELSADPTGGVYSFPQEVTLKAYSRDPATNEAEIDQTAKIYFTVNQMIISERSNLYSEPILIDADSTIRFFAVDEQGNKSDTETLEFYFDCPNRQNADEIGEYPECNIIECSHGFKLQNDICVSILDNDPNDYTQNAIPAPLFSSSAPMYITSKPAILITKDHNGVIPRPIVFKEDKRGTIIRFERDTKITKNNGALFNGYIKHLTNLYSKDFPINYGYTFKSIFEFKDAEGNDLNFSPDYEITVPYTDGFAEDEISYVFTYDPETEVYTVYNKDKFDVNMDKKEVKIRANKTGIFFIGQKGKKYNKSIFNDIETHWAKNYIEELYRKGIVKGRSKGVFAPDDRLTRAEFTKIVLEAIAADVPSYDEVEDTYFDDVPLFAWYAAYVNTAKELGLINGYSDGTFKPDQFINRAEAVKMLISAFKFKLDVSMYEQSGNPFADTPANKWYYPYIKFAASNGIVDARRDDHGRLIKSAFGPGNFITRAEMAKLAIKAMEMNE